jgi:hypothetical protein
MAIEHHFILKYTSENGWELDYDSEEVRFPDGTVFNDETNEWSSGYAGDGEFVDNDDVIGDQLAKAINQMNGDD